AVKGIDAARAALIGIAKTAPAVKPIPLQLARWDQLPTYSAAAMNFWRRSPADKSPAPGGFFLRNTGEI
ncbi:MAG: hypothetical protein ACOCVG_05240, partial [Verrucomicrobiota bacterium]